jgi:hypothetical protein
LSSIPPYGWTIGHCNLQAATRLQNGARVNELMGSIVENLDDEQMADVASHFSALIRGQYPRAIQTSFAWLFRGGGSPAAPPVMARTPAAPSKRRRSRDKGRNICLRSSPPSRAGTGTTISTTACVGSRRNCARMRSKSSRNITPPAPRLIICARPSPRRPPFQRAGPAECPISLPDRTKTFHVNSFVR